MNNKVCEFNGVRNFARVSNVSVSVKFGFSFS